MWAAPGIRSDRSGSARRRRATTGRAAIGRPRQATGQVAHRIIRHHQATGRVVLRSQRPQATGRVAQRSYRHQTTGRDHLLMVKGRVTASGHRRGRDRVGVSDHRRGRGRVEVSDHRRGRGRVEVSGHRRGRGRVGVSDHRRGRGRVEVSDHRRGRGRVGVSGLRRGRGRAVVSGRSPCLAGRQTPPGPPGGSPNPAGECSRVVRTRASGLRYSLLPLWDGRPKWYLDSGKASAQELPSLLPPVSQCFVVPLPDTAIATSATTGVRHRRRRTQAEIPSTEQGFDLPDDRLCIVHTFHRQGKGIEKLVHGGHHGSGGQARRSAGIRPVRSGWQSGAMPFGYCALRATSWKHPYPHLKMITSSRTDSPRGR
jgi:hypothetical protein